MPALKDPQYEKFASELAELKPVTEAYKLAGYKPHRGNANRLARRPEIRARVQQLLDEAAEYADIRRVRVLVEIDRVGRANIADFFEADGRTLKNIATLPRALTAAIAAVGWIEDGQDAEGKPKYRAELKFHDKNQANFTLLKHLGGLPEPANNEFHNIFNLLSVEDQRIVVGALEAFGGGPKAVNGPAETEPQPA